MVLGEVYVNVRALLLRGWSGLRDLSLIVHVYHIWGECVTRVLGARFPEVAPETFFLLKRRLCSFCSLISVFLRFCLRSPSSSSSVLSFARTIRVCLF